MLDSERSTITVAVAPRGRASSWKGARGSLRWQIDWPLGAPSPLVTSPAGDHLAHRRQTSVTPAHLTWRGQLMVRHLRRRRSQRFHEAFLMFIANSDIVPASITYTLYQIRRFIGQYPFGNFIVVSSPKIIDLCTVSKVFGGECGCLLNSFHNEEQYTIITMWIRSLRNVYVNLKKKGLLTFLKSGFIMLW